MTKKELFEKYSINDSHNIWEPIDSWSSVEIYRLMHDGKLPPKDDLSIKWITDFLDKAKLDMGWWVKNVMSRSDWGSLYRYRAIRRRRIKPQNYVRSTNVEHTTELY